MKSPPWTENPELAAKSNPPSCKLFLRTFVTVDRKEKKRQTHRGHGDGGLRRVIFQMITNVPQGSALSDSPGRREERTLEGWLLAIVVPAGQDEHRPCTHLKRVASLLSAQAGAIRLGLWPLDANFLSCPHS